MHACICRYIMLPWIRWKMKLVHGSCLWKMLGSDLGGFHSWQTLWMLLYNHLHTAFPLPVPSRLLLYLSG
ncbi:hypothetical protein HanIR_Chr07g0299811 [Helianthus annuus]|nr:hypothetical protein HanIR_Chr07g0299811 [Helianthus annuus]